MVKLAAIVSDFDDTLFFSKKAISYAANELYKITKENKNTSINNFDIKKLELIMAEGKVPHGFDKSFKNELYTLAYTKYSNMLIPNTSIIKYIKEVSNKDLDLIILSARGEEFRDKTEEALISNGLKTEKVILPNNHDLSDEHWKYLKLKELVKDYSHIILFEDKEENIKYISSRLGNEIIEFYLVEGNTLKRMQ